MSPEVVAAAGVVVSLLSVFVGAAVSVFVARTSASSSIKVGLINEQRNAIMQLSKLLGETNTTLRVLSQMVQLNQADVIKGQFDKLQSDIGTLSTFYYEKKVIISKEIRGQLDGVMKLYTDVTVHTFLSTTRSADGKYLFLTESTNQRKEYVKLLIKSESKIANLSTGIEKTMRSELGVEK